MPSSPPPPPQGTSRRGRVLQPTKRKHQAPITTFVKAFKKARTALTPGRRGGDSAETQHELDSDTDGPTATAPSLSCAPTSTAGTTLHATAAGAVSHATTTGVTAGAPSRATTAGARLPRNSRSVVIEDSDEDLDRDDQSSNGDVLPLDDDVIILETEPGNASTSKSNGRSKGKGSVGDLGLERHGEKEDAPGTKPEFHWNVPVYGFFKPEPSTKPYNGRRCYTWECVADRCHMPTRFVRRYADKKVVDPKTGLSKLVLDNSTGNMRIHVKKCFGQEALEAADKAKTADEVRKTMNTSGGVLSAQAITVAFSRSGKGKVTYSTRPHTEAESRAETVRWVAENMRPSSIVKDRGYNCLMKTGRPHHYIPSPSTVARDVKMVFANVRNRIGKLLREHPGSLHFATDCWTSPNHRAYAAFTVHFEQNGSPFALLLDLIEIPRSHTGLNLAIEFARLLREFGIEHKILSVTCDNTSNNEAMVRELQKRIDSFAGEASLTRCFLHIVNLVARTTIRVFDVPPKKKTGDSLDEAQVQLQKLAEDLEIEEMETRLAMAQEARGSEGGDDGDGDQDEMENSMEGWVDERELMDEDERHQLDESVLPVRLAILKLRRLSYAILHSSTILLPLWYETLAALKLAAKAMPRDVATRWNSTYDMLKFAVEYRMAIETMVKEKALRCYELDDDEWEMVSQLTDILKVYKHATLFFSRGTPSLPTVIPAMDHIDDVLTEQVLNKTKLLPSIRAACTLSKQTLNRYYDKTDESENYRIAMILHPSFKLEYFRGRNWLPSWVDTAEGMVRDEFERSYAHLDVSDDHLMAIALEDGTSSTSRREPNMFDSLPSLASHRPTVSQDELERYLSSPVEKNVSEPMIWWRDRVTLYPRLSRMALDYLSIPATSVDVERCFSRGRILLSHLRNRMSAQTTRALMCLNYWSRVGLVRDRDVLKTVREFDALDGDEDLDLEEGWDAIELD